MRCDYCGWENADGAERCVKCNQPLPEEVFEPEPVVEDVKEEVVAPAPESTPLGMSVSAPSSPRATVVFQREDVGVSASVSNDAYCPQCGYPFTDASVKECPACGAQVVVDEPIVAPQPAPAPQPVVVPPPAPATQPVATPQSSPMNHTVMDFARPSSVNKADMKRTVMDAGAINSQPEVPANNHKQTVMDANSVVSQEQNAAMKRTVMDAGAINNQPEVPANNHKQTVMDANSVVAQEQKAAMKQTVRDFSILEQVEREASESKPAAKPGMRLEPMDNFEGKAAPISVDAGGELLLNRANVDPENPTIDANEQARIVSKNDEWFIKNLSKSHNTYISTSREIKLEAGDIVVIGNKRFIIQ